MRSLDRIAFAWGSLRSYPGRTSLVLLAISIGVAAVLLLTALGDGARRYIVDQFAGLGSNLLIVLPGKTETRGGAPPLVSDMPRDITLDDALVLTRHPLIARVAPLAFGLAPVAAQGREREAPILGTTGAMLEIRRLEVAQGRFLSDEDPRQPRAECVLGAKVRRELFGAQGGLGNWVRIGDRRFRVIGVLASKGTSLGIDMDDVVLVPVAAAFALFDKSSLFRIMVQARSREAIPAAKVAVEATLRERHEGEEDVTVITQDALMGTFDAILGMVTLVLAAIAAISLLVAGILILNVMVVVVTQRTAEIGLLKALGGAPRDLRALFLWEAFLLSLLGATVGVAIGYSGAHALGRAWPALAGGPPVWATAAAVLLALGAGLAFGVLPANRAARLDPVRALARR
ncbi:MAG: ABC transporter permease [Planctomycetes bacterium]|nr:ABC transporter permease [Planctomycetota bacterium]